MVSRNILSAVSVMNQKGTEKASLFPHVPSKKNSPPQRTSPFLNGMTSEEGIREPEQSFSETGIPSGKITQPEASSPTSTKKALLKGFFSSFTGSKKKILMVFIGLILLLGIGGFGTWYLLRWRGEKVVSSEPVSESISVPEPAMETPLPQPPFVADAPNYLSIDTETVTAQSFRILLDQTGAKIAAARMAQPVEFFLTDKNNNPIAFSRFAFLMDLGLSEEVVAVLGEPFSLFLYDDGGKARLGLRLTLVDASIGEKLLIQKEKTFPLLFRPLLFPGSTVAREVVFRSGVYNTDTVRFVNIDEAQGTSFDFTLRDNEWFIGTSKDTLRAILDKKRK